jgi:hypothetical protein
LGQTVLTLLGVLLLFLASFTSFEVPIATKRNLRALLKTTRYAFNIVPERYQSKVAMPLLKV